MTTCATDKEKFLALMQEFGVHLTMEEDKGIETFTIMAGSSSKVEGYTCFCADWSFNASTGAFIKVGIWE